MADPTIARNEFFVDAGFVIALINRHDQLHTAARLLSVQLRASSARLVTTQAVLFEIGNALAKQRYRAEAVRLLASMQNDPLVEIVPITPVLFDKAFNLYRTRPDKEWGLVDSFSFVVMAERGLQQALSADEHFEQAGFRLAIPRR